MLAIYYHRVLACSCCDAAAGSIFSDTTTSSSCFSPDKDGSGGRLSMRRDLNSLLCLLDELHWCRVIHDSLCDTALHMLLVSDARQAECHADSHPGQCPCIWSHHGFSRHIRKHFADVSGSIGGARLWCTAFGCLPIGSLIKLKLGWFSLYHCGIAEQH